MIPTGRCACVRWAWYYRRIIQLPWFTPQTENLSRSISLFKEALDSIKGKHHPLRPIWITYLANSLLLRFLLLGSQEDINWAISMLEETTAELPRGHWYRPTSCNTLACLYSTRFQSLLGWQQPARAIMEDSSRRE
jgi:hypothetical protein